MISMLHGTTMMVAVGRILHLYMVGKTYIENIHDDIVLIITAFLLKKFRLNWLYM